MREDLEALVRDHLDGSLDQAGRERLARELEGDPQALAEFADQLQIHHRLGAALGPESASLVDPILRELRLLGDSERFSQGVVGRLKRGAGRRRLWETLAAGAVLAILGFLLLFKNPTPPASAAARQALLVVGHVPLEPGDARVRERMETLNFRVVTMTAREVTPADAEGKAFVALSSTALARDVLTVSGELTVKFRDSAVPVITWEPRLFYDLGMIPGSTHQKDWAATRQQTHLMIAAPGHPLAAGLTGRVRASAEPAQYSWGRVREDAIKVATLEADPAHAAIFAYDRGAAMPGLVAPAPRAGLFLFDTTSLSLTPEGWALFDAAVRWCSESRRSP